MPDHITPPVYTLRSCTSTIDIKGTVSQEELPHQISNWTNQISSGYAVCQLEHQLLIGRLEGGTLLFNQGQQPDYAQLLHLRIFNQHTELFVRRGASGCYRYRQRTDGPEDSRLNLDNNQFVESDLPLWGTTHSSESPGWTVSSEERGISLTLPLDGLQPEQHALLRVRSYIGYAESGQAGYQDLRYVDLLAGGAS